MSKAIYFSNSNSTAICFKFLKNSDRLKNYDLLNELISRIHMLSHMLSHIMSTPADGNRSLVKIWIRILIEKADNLPNEPVSKIHRVVTHQVNPNIVHKKISKVTYFSNPNYTAIYFSMLICEELWSKKQMTYLTNPFRKSIALSHIMSTRTLSSSVFPSRPVFRPTYRRIALDWVIFMSPTHIHIYNIES